MRVLHVGKYFPPFAGGMESFLADLLPALDACGVSGPALVHDERPGWRGTWPSCPQSPPVYRAPTYGRLLYAPISPAFPRWLKRLIHEWRPDLLHLHLPNTSAFAALALPSARRLPWVIHWHSDVVASTLDPRLRLAYRFYRPFEQRLLSASRRVIVTSPPYLEFSPALAPWRGRCEVIPLGIDPARIAEPESAVRARADALWGRSGLRVLAIGRLTYYKGHEVLIRAASAFSDCRVLIVGTGDLGAPLTELVRSLGLESRVGLLGYQSDAMLNALLASCDLLCLPSIERTEAFGLVLLEAMRFGKAVVASDLPGSGMGWVVREAGHGLLTPPGDSGALAAALRRLSQDSDLKRQLGDAGKVALARGFGIDQVAKAIAGLYARILS